MGTAARVRGGDRPRPYRSVHRERQAAGTRAAILAAATTLFSERGWSGTGVRDIATAADVAVETVYAAFDSKAGVLLAAVDAAVVGDDAAIPLSQRPEFAALAAGSRRRRANALAALGTAIHRRTAGVMTALQQAATSEPQLRDRSGALEQARRDDLAAALRLVAGRSVSATERDGVWAVGSADVYRMLTGIAGWTDEQYERWAADTVVRLLDRTRPTSRPRGAR